MLECWQARPTHRPSFTDLSETLGAMLEESVRNHYIELNDHYMNMNMIQLEGHCDYLSMMSAPTYGNLVSPSYEGHEQHYTIKAIPMGTQTKRQAHLDLFVSSGTAAELRPMLTNAEESDSKSPSQINNLNNLNQCATMRNDAEPMKEMKITNDLKLGQTSSGQTPSFSNPNYQSTITPSPDNYVNMPQHKICEIICFSRVFYGFIDIPGTSKFLEAAVFSWSSHTDDCCQPTKRVPDGPEARSLEPYYTLVSKCADPLSRGVNSAVDSFFHLGSTPTGTAAPHGSSEVPTSGIQWMPHSAGLRISRSLISVHPTAYRLFLYIKPIHFLTVMVLKVFHVSPVTTTGISLIATTGRHYQFPNRQV
uniref:Serine-threonine/tyrosine-protein kinase catalytic domain-containing protein n=1 Tax=Timema tahoe TaxID=61484 RepID=A0A7R9IC08_9NEOP|nr:unnamed protein product [Timema tahoe]